MGAFRPGARAVVGPPSIGCSHGSRLDNLVRGQSTFMVEMSETSAILHGATARSLVPARRDRRGTSPTTGWRSPGPSRSASTTGSACKTVFATHYHELTAASPRSSRTPANFNVGGPRVRRRDRVPPPPGARRCGPLLWIHVGRLAGLPAPVVARAWEAAETAGGRASRRPIVRCRRAPTRRSSASSARTRCVAELEGLDVDALSPPRSL